jgi:hypothetical protein
VSLREVLILAAVVTSAALPGPPAQAQDLRRPEEQLAAIYSLSVQLEIEQRRLDDALQRYHDHGRSRDERRARLARAYEEIDAMVEGRVESDPAQVAAREQDILQLEEEATVLAREGREIRAVMRDAHDRIAILSDRIAGLRKTLPSDTESLTGIWEVTYLPSGDKGVFTLRQSGTLLAGEYTFDGGWKGSLQGTFVNDRLLLHRIDSKLGRSSDLEGTLGPDGRTIRGTWNNYILSGGQPVTGSWIGRKRQER